MCCSAIPPKGLVKGGSHRIPTQYTGAILFPFKFFSGGPGNEAIISTLRGQF